jgi:excisionase family DNA binding protein
MASTTDRRSRTRLLTIKDVAADLNVSVKTVRRMIGDRKLSVHRIGRAIRVAEEELVVFIHRAKQNDHA